MTRAALRARSLSQGLQRGTRQSFSSSGISTERSAAGRRAQGNDNNDPNEARLMAELWTLILHTDTDGDRLEYSAGLTSNDASGHGHDTGRAWRSGPFTPDLPEGYAQTVAEKEKTTAMEKIFSAVETGRSCHEFDVPQGSSGTGPSWLESVDLEPPRKLRRADMGAKADCGTEQMEEQCAAMETGRVEAAGPEDPTACGRLCTVFTASGKLVNQEELVANMFALMAEDPAVPSQLFMTLNAPEPRAGSVSYGLSAKQQWILLLLAGLHDVRCKLRNVTKATRNALHNICGIDKTTLKKWCKNRWTGGCSVQASAPIPEERGCIHNINEDVPELSSETDPDLENLLRRTAPTPEQLGFIHNVVEAAPELALDLPPLAVAMQQRTTAGLNGIGSRLSTPGMQFGSRLSTPGMQFGTTFGGGYLKRGCSVQGPEPNPALEDWLRRLQEDVQELDMSMQQHTTAGV